MRVSGLFLRWRSGRCPAYLRRKRRMRAKWPRAKCAYVDPRRGGRRSPSRRVSCTKERDARVRRLDAFLRRQHAPLPLRAPTKGRLPSEDRGHVALALRAGRGIFKGTRHDALALDFVGDDFQVTHSTTSATRSSLGRRGNDRRAWRISVAGNALRRPPGRRRRCRFGR